MRKSWLVISVLFVLCSVGLNAATLPVKVTVRPSSYSRNTFASQFDNKGDKEVALRVQFERADGAVKKSFTLSVPAKQTSEIGKVQGWFVRTGDKITVTCDGYDDMHYHVP